MRESTPPFWSDDVFQRLGRGSLPSASDRPPAADHAVARPPRWRFWMIVTRRSGQVGPASVSNASVSSGRPPVWPWPSELMACRIPRRSRLVKAGRSSWISEYVWMNSSAQATASTPASGRKVRAVSRTDGRMRCGHHAVAQRGEWMSGASSAAGAPRPRPRTRSSSKNAGCLLFAAGCKYGPHPSGEAAACPHRELGTKVFRITGGPLMTAWRVRTQVTDKETVTFLMGVIRSRGAVGSVFRLIPEKIRSFSRRGTQAARTRAERAMRSSDSGLPGQYSKLAAGCKYSPQPRSRRLRRPLPVSAPPRMLLESGPCSGSAFWPYWRWWPSTVFRGRQFALVAVRLSGASCRAQNGAGENRPGVTGRSGPLSSGVQLGITLASLGRSENSRLRAPSKAPPPTADGTRAHILIHGAALALSLSF
jgi:hypothetical protein